MKITIILGAGASIAYERMPRHRRYPSLGDLLPRMLEIADTSYASNLSLGCVRRKLIDDYGAKQRLCIAYALLKAYGLKSPILDIGEISDTIIEEQYNRIMALPASNFHIETVFKSLENLAEKEVATRAYWALNHAISFYMLQMATENDEANIATYDNAHVNLIKLISQLINRGHDVKVVDFNYDCILEKAWDGCGTNRTFGWDYGRVRNVFDNDDHPLSILASKNLFKPQVDTNTYTRTAKIIKPHGDMCTFLRGNVDVFYRGGRHSKTTSSIFSKLLADIADDDKFVRSSIMPPAESRFRHKADFYCEEKYRFKAAPMESTVFILIGWSASGTDQFYYTIFREALQDKSLSPRLFLIDYSNDGTSNADLEDRLIKLFGQNAILEDVQMHGLNEAAVKQLGELLLS